MAFPARVAKALRDAGIDVPKQGWFASDGTLCEGAKFHSPTPLVLRDVSLIPGSSPVDLTAVLCATCADNLSVLQQLLVANDGELPWPVRREFGNQLRALAFQGWEEYLRSKKAKRKKR
jgi:hypothetical protein